MERRHEQPVSLEESLTTCWPNELQSRPWLRFPPPCIESPQEIAGAPEASAERRKPPETAIPSTYSHRACRRLYPGRGPLCPTALPALAPNGNATLLGLVCIPKVLEATGNTSFAARHKQINRALVTYCDLLPVYNEAGSEFSGREIIRGGYTMRVWRLQIVLAGMLLSSPRIQAQEAISPLSPPNWPVPQYILYSAVPADGSDGAQRMEFDKALPTAPTSFVGITPCRMVDTRAGSGFGGAYGPPSLAATPRDFVLTGRCGVPAQAVAVSLNFTVVVPTGDGFLSAFPTAGTVPIVSTLNFRAGQVLANAALVPLGSGGAITVFTNGASTDLLIDVNGYFTPPPVSQKVCAISYHNTFGWTDTIPVPAAWTAAMCNAHRVQVTGTTNSAHSTYYLGCLTDTGLTWGSPNGGVPSSNCGW